MSPATDVNQVRSGLFVWQNYDPSVKADLFSTALETAAGLFLIDPIRLATEAFDELAGTRKLAGVIVTNANHHRDSVRQANRFSLPLFAHVDAALPPEVRQLRKLESGTLLGEDLRAIAIEGAAPGEIVLHHEKDNGTMVVGDALINFEPYGFTFLPAKYCSNGKQMCRSLRQLLDFEFERMLFAHGTPLLNSARKQLQQLLGSDG
jgi:glyoxylase-like metal-dependent hydrolase (beta-lactamase superfamily II)